MRSTAPILSLVVLAAACAAPPAEKDPLEFEAYDSRAIQGKSRPIGPFLTELDNSIERWQVLSRNARTDGQRREKRLLEEHLTYQATTRVDDLIDQLQSPAVQNRMVAASALGFAEVIDPDEDPDPLGPLLAALEDSSDDVVANALLGIALLGRSDTPLVGLTTYVTGDDDERIRSNAAYAILEVLQSGGEGGSTVRAAARVGLQDESPLVRSYSALTLAQLLDEDSFDLLQLQLHDDVPIAALASARGIAYIGGKDVERKGASARALAAALRDVKPTVRDGLLRYLRQLAQANYGQDDDAWLDWAHRLP